MRRPQFSLSACATALSRRKCTASDFVRVEAAGVLDSPGGRQVQAVHEHQDDVTMEDGHLGRFHGAFVELLSLGSVLAVETDERHSEDREEEHDRPRPLLELGHREDQHNDRGQDRGTAVDHQLVPPAAFAVHPVVFAHPRARHRETRENADGIDRYQGRHVRPRNEQEGYGDDGEDDDPVGESQPVPAFGELAWQEAVPRHEARQEREAVEARIAAGIEDQQGGELDHVEQGVPGGPGAEHRLRFLRDDRGSSEDKRGGVGPPG